MIGQGDSQKSDYRFLKDQGFNNMQDFALSHGEKANPDGFDNAKVILGAMRQDEPGSAAGRWYSDEKAKGNEPTLK